MSVSTLARFSAGRVLLHLLAMLGDGEFRFHFAGILRELSWVELVARLLVRARSRFVGALVAYLAAPVRNSIPERSAGCQRQPIALSRGDVLLSRGNTPLAALIERITESRWTHVSMYVGPLENGPDPVCIVEADIAAGVRSIRLSELNALEVCVLRPVRLSETDRGQLADWVVSRIGADYDLSHAWSLCRKLLCKWLPVQSRPSPAMRACNATRFICCTLLAHAFAFVGYPIVASKSAAAMDHGSLTPGDFEHVSLFEVIGAAASSVDVS
jgi:hypothetical protein